MKLILIVAVLILANAIAGEERIRRAPASRCLKPKDPGYCGYYLLRYYYDVYRRKCAPFYYSGCGDNGNNFRTFSECHYYCMR
ncbi:PI-stichotoxin-She2b-like [Crassostrea virginica]